MFSTFVETIRDPSKDEEFDRGMERVFKENPHLGNDVKEYRKCREFIKNYKLEDGYQNLVETRKKMINLENSIIVKYKNLCTNEFKEIVNITRGAYSLEGVKNSANIPEYVDVIGKIMVDNKFSTYNRLGDKFTDEFKKLEEKDNAENAAEQAKENGNEIKKADKGKAKGDAVNTAPKKEK